MEKSTINSLLSYSNLTLKNLFKYAMVNKNTYAQMKPLINNVRADLTRQLREEQTKYRTWYNSLTNNQRVQLARNYHRGEWGNLQTNNHYYVIPALRHANLTTKSAVSAWLLQETRRMHVHRVLPVRVYKILTSMRNLKRKLGHYNGPHSRNAFYAFVRNYHYPRNL